MGINATAESGLCMVTRYPQPGQTKTRLIPALGPHGAAQLQQQMTEHLIARFQAVCDRHQLALEVHFAGGSEAQMQNWLGPQISFCPQREGNLGDRLNHVFERGFAQRRQRLLVTGSDCPGVGERQIVRALAQLKQHDVVLGPAEDGGYYLIGLKAPQPSLFESIHWGQSCVLRQTIAIATAQRLSVGLLQPLPDIDRPEDLPRFAAYWEDANKKPQVRL